VRLAAALILATVAASAQAQSRVTLAWDPSPGTITGYRLYQGSANQTYTNVIDVGTNTSATVSNLSSGATYFFAVTAYDSNGSESDFSNQITYQVALATNPPPAIALMSPVDGGSYMEGASISLSASVTSHGHAISRVDFYNGEILLGSDSLAPYSFSWASVIAGTYSLSAKAVYDSGDEIASAPVKVTVTPGGSAPPPPPSSGLSVAADSGTLSAPFVASHGTIYQPVETSLTAGGRAVYNFNLGHAGNYLVLANVRAPNEGQNSFYINIDAEPTDPLMIWDIPPGPTLKSCTVTWRGNGTPEAATAQYKPKVFALSAGAHQLIVRGREANTTLGTITIAATPPRLRIIRETSPAGVVPPTSPATILSATGQPRQAYNVLWSQDLKTWALIGTLTLDATGAGDFTDPAGTDRQSSYYRLQGQ
jgi:hypothetical protein